MPNAKLPAYRDVGDPAAATSGDPLYRKAIRSLNVVVAAGIALNRLFVR